MQDAFGRITSSPTIIERLAVSRRADESLEMSIKRTFPCERVDNGDEVVRIYTEHHVYTYAHSGASRQFFSGAPLAHLPFVRVDALENHSHFSVME